MVISVVGALMVSIDTGLIVNFLALPEPFARVLLWRVWLLALERVASALVARELVG